ncbi:PDDEXK nuclease domain-containing protein [Mucilaginibacter sp. 10I4]|uniref:PDDEXK nuclease domain-containing protein n=1 Tax=Mucilaginibacter sp. 10I4 TaxID=3048580 RepID=UPI002B23A2A9|nr:PDDEXK nuclease domain-containing protein [Mucilaginibacter sp. 10I4]MEB0260513.1 PDDEXK nuclease domain-containing protein [Mucilaginibacter sp. 10I4]
MEISKGGLYADIKSILEQARGNAVRAVNFSMVIAYYEIGKRIVEDEQHGNERAAYGESVLKELSKKLTADFGKGFTAVNLENFRKFYQIFSENSKSYAVRRKLDEPKSDAVRRILEAEKSSASRTISANSILHALRTELSWTHYRLLMRVEDEAARNYYMNEAAEQNWSTRVLERQINSLYFQRLLSSKNKQPLIAETETENQQDQPNIFDFVKDPYILEFLQLQPNATLYERELETELLNKLQLFLLELGKGFSFVARQKRISADNEHFYIDLVFYNYILKCFILVDLKVGKLSHQDIGQMDLYVRYYEDQIKQDSDNPTIGLILCTEKNETIVKYSVLKESKQIFASKYKLYLPSEKELIDELNAELEQLKNKKL